MNALDTVFIAITSILLLLFAAGCRDSTRVANQSRPDATNGEDASRPPPMRESAGADVAPAPENKIERAQAGNSRPRTPEYADERERMVSDQMAARDVTDARVLAAMRAVPRHWFVPEQLQGAAYDDRPLPIGEGQTISQPYIVALMTQSLDLKPGEKVLEIGTGSGYQAAVLAELTDQVYTIEIVESLARKAKSILDARGYRGIQTRVGDGYRGWPAAAPFDAIIVTCSPDSPPQPLIDQLAVGGRMCIPVGSGLYGQELVLITRQADGSLKRATIAPVAFVPMTGEAQERD